MTRSARTVLGIALFIPLAVVLLATFACLPVPIGDPEKAKIDDRLTGAWRVVPNDPTDTALGLAVLRPLDTHTWYLQYISYGEKDHPDQVSTLNYRAWLTELGGATFIVCETLDDAGFLNPDPEHPDRYYWIAKLDIKPDAIRVLQLDDKFEPLKDVKTREKAEEIILANINNDKMYGEAMNFKKLAKDQLDLIGEARKKANIGVR